jgi:hypothetical protein
MLVSGCSAIENAHRTLINKYTSESERTKHDDELARKFFSEYTDLDLHHQGRIVFKLCRLYKDKKKIIYRYYKKLRNYNTQLMPLLKEVNDELSWREIFPFAPFAVVINMLMIKMKDLSITVAADVWAYLCLGLRPAELKKVKLFTKEGNRAMFVKLKDTKTNKVMVRYVPRSLIKIAKLAALPSLSPNIGWWS